MHARHVLTLTAACCLILCLTAPGARAEKSTGATMAEGAVNLAKVLHSGGKGVAAVGQLLSFALTVDPDNRSALLLQARLQRGLAFDPPELRGGVENYTSRYIRYLENIAAKTKSESHRLLLFRVIEIIDPGHESAMVALAKAGNDGIDTSMGSLLTAIGGGEAVRIKVSRTPSRTGQADPAASAQKDEGTSGTVVNTQQDTGTSSRSFEKADLQGAWTITHGKHSHKVKIIWGDDGLYTVVTGSVFGGRFRVEADRFTMVECSHGYRGQVWLISSEEEMTLTSQAGGAGYAGAVMAREAAAGLR